MKIVMPVYEDVDMLDICGPYEMFRWAGFDVDLVAEAPGQVRFNRGFTFDVADGLGAALSCDALWVPGGNPASLSRIIHDHERTFLDFLVRQAAVSRYVCSVCEGALLLAAAGLLDGFTATTHWAFIPYLIENYPKVAIADGHPRFHLDGDRLTGGGISSGLDEALKLIALLAGRGAAEGVQQNTQYYPDPPVASLIPNAIKSPMPAVC
ncbi:MAG: transcriptional regulator [Alphaproteobacteria bacterium]|nr:transcriptional regulator [Alphaproteobacteria bacterium]